VSALRTKADPLAFGDRLRRGRRGVQRASHGPASHHEVRAGCGFEVRAGCGLEVWAGCGFEVWAGRGSVVIIDRLLARQAVPGADQLAAERPRPVRHDHIRVPQLMTVRAVRRRDLGDAAVGVRPELDHAS
jgi:hypothetical protein